MGGSGDTRIADGLLLAECRDPLGHLLHVWAAAFALLLAPLGVVPAEVGLWTLVAVCLVRSSRLTPSWASALEWPALRWLAGLVAMAALSLLWSSEPAHGALRVKGLRAVMYTLALWPVLWDAVARGMLMRALGAGIALLALTQIADSLSLTSGSAARMLTGSGGLHGEPGKAAMWCAVGVCLTAGSFAAPAQSRTVLIPAIALGTLSVAGICIAGSLRIAAALIIALCLAPMVTALLRIPATARFAVACAVALAALAAGVAALNPDMPSSAKAQLQSVFGSASADGTDKAQLTELQRRAIWWQAEWDAFLRHPALGAGWGSTPQIVGDSDALRAASDRAPSAVSEDLRHPGHPHSLYLMTLGELGAVGAMLLTGLLATLAWNALRAARDNPSLTGAFAALVVWIAAAAGDTVTNSSSIAVCAIIAVLTLCPSSVPRLSPEERTRLAGGRIRVAVFVERFGFPGGSERFSQHTVELMAESGRFEFHVFAHKWRSERSDIHFYHVPLPRFSRVLRPWLFAQTASRMIEAGEFDVVHAHGALPHADVVSVHGAPRRYWVREIKHRRMLPFDLVSDRVEGSVLRNGGQTVFLPVSTLLHDIYRQTWGALPGDWKVLHPGVDGASFARNEERREAMRSLLGAHADDVVLLFVGMNFEIKGLGLLIEAVAHHAQQRGHTALRIVVVGKGDESLFRSLARQHGIEERVTFVGVCQTGIDAYYSAADAFVLLSTFETFCIAALEAMAASLPVIVTERMGIRDLVIDGEHGFVVSTDATPEDVAIRLRAIATRDLRLQMGERARATAERHSWRSVTDRLAVEYEAVMARRVRTDGSRAT